MNWNLPPTKPTPLVEGLSCWIGDNFCRPNPQESTPMLAGAKGVGAKIPYIDQGGRGVVRQLPAITGTFGAKTHSGEPSGRGVAKFQGEALLQWFEALAERMRFAKVCCGDWSRVLSKAATFGQGLTAVLLDPPYDAGASHDDVYGDLSRGVSAKVRAWAIENGDNPLMRIALCGYEGEHEMPSTWECVAWKAAGGYGRGNGNETRERIWFSPACLKPQAELFDLPAA